MGQVEALQIPAVLKRWRIPFVEKPQISPMVQKFLDSFLTSPEEHLPGIICCTSANSHASPDRVASWFFRQALERQAISRFVYLFSGPETIDLFDQRLSLSEDNPRVRFQTKLLSCTFGWCRELVPASLSTHDQGLLFAMLCSIRDHQVRLIISSTLPTSLLTQFIGPANAALISSFCSWVEV